MQQNDITSKKTEVNKLKRSLDTSNKKQSHINEYLRWHL